MKMNNILKKITGGSVLIMACYAACGEGTPLGLIRERLNAMERALPQGNVDYRVLYEYPSKFTHLPDYSTFAICVSNNYGFVMTNFASCATNKTEKLLLMSAGWAYDDDYYLRYMDGLLSVALAGGISNKEFRWFRIGHDDELRMNILALRYQEQLVSNIVDKLERLTADTNQCNKIRSGEARASYLQYYNEINATREE